MRIETRYLTTDLDIEANIDLTPLAEALEKKGLLVGHVKHWENGFWSAQFATCKWYDSPEKCIVRMLNAAESLNKTSRSLWDACTVRNFDIGYDCGEEPRYLIHKLSTTTLQKVVMAGGTIVLTLYSLRQDEDSASFTSGDHPGSKN